MDDLAVKIECLKIAATLGGTAEEINERAGIFYRALQPPKFVGARTAALYAKFADSEPGSVVKLDAEEAKALGF